MVNNVPPDLENEINTSRARLQQAKPKAYNKLLKYLQSEKDGNPSPYLIDFAFSFACNFHCPHCCASLLRTLPGQQAMTLDNVKKIADEADKMGVFVFNLIGGEPLVWGNLQDVINIIDPSRFHISITTNGSLLDLAKARKIRELLKISSGIEFRQGDIYSLGEQKYDILICTGVLHHLDNIPLAVEKLRSACGKLLILETIVLSSRYMTKAFKKEIEMKDVIYFGRGKICGISGQKYESDYYDGSADKTRVVTIPSLQSLEMYLESSGFSNTKIILAPGTYRRLWKKERYQKTCTKV